jgi:hypothetical protein
MSCKSIDITCYLTEEEKFRELIKDKEDKLDWNKIFEDNIVPLTLIKEYKEKHKVPFSSVRSLHYVSEENIKYVKEYISEFTNKLPVRNSQMFAFREMRKFFDEEHFDLELANTERDYKEVIHHFGKDFVYNKFKEGRVNVFHLHNWIEYFYKHAEEFLKNDMWVLNNRIYKLKDYKETLPLFKKYHIDKYNNFITNEINDEFYGEIITIESVKYIKRKYEQDDIKTALSKFTRKRISMLTFIISFIILSGFLFDGLELKVSVFKFFIVFIISVFLATPLVSFVKGPKTHKITAIKTNIYSIGGNYNNINGSFTLGSGYVNSEEQYSYFITNSDGSKIKNYVSAKTTKIFEGDYKSPHIKVYTCVDGYSYDVFFGGRADKDKCPFYKKAELFIPKESIIKSFNIN